MSEANKEKLLDLMWKNNSARAFRIDPKIALMELILPAAEIDTSFDYADLRELSHFYPEVKEGLFPEIISNFIVSLLKDFRPVKIYDPWVKTGSLLSILVEKLQPSEGAVGVTYDGLDHLIATNFTKNQNITWQKGDLDDYLDDDNPNDEAVFRAVIEKEDDLFFNFNDDDNSDDEAVFKAVIEKESNLLGNIEKLPNREYDLVVCAPQFDIKSKWTFEDDKELFDEFDEDDKDIERFEYKKSIEVMHEIYEEYDGYIADVLMRTVGNNEKLLSRGTEIGIFVVSPYFFNETKEDNPELDRARKSLNVNLQSMRNLLDCSIDAAFKLPNSIFDPFTSTPLYLIIVRHGKSALKNHKLFVGQLSGDEKQDAILVKNYHERKEGGIPQQGALIEESEFKGLDTLINNSEIKQLVARSGVVAYPFNQISNKINFLGKTTVNDSFSDSDSCIYLPMIGDSPAVSSVNEFILQPQEYVQLVLEAQSDKIEPLIKEFNSPDGLKERINLAWEWARRSRVSPFYYDNYYVEVNFYGTQNFQDKSSEDNCVYLPVIGISAVVITRNEFTLEASEYIQIYLDSEKVFAPYFAAFLNSRLGLKIREGLFIGLKLPGITRASLESSTMYLPDLNTQKEVMRINADIVNLSAELSSLHNRLWQSPTEVIKIEKRMRQFSQEKGWEIWLEDLPFPMASILWAYLSTVDPKDKLEHISHFFEATSQFFAMICLSAVAQDKEFYRLNQKHWVDENPKYKEWYKNAGFGGWRTLHSSLAKFIRGMLSREDTKSKCLSLFGNASEQFIQIIAGKRLVNIFDTANTYRNQWIGHRGRLSDEDAGKQAAAFEDLLSKMREVIADSFSQLLLLSPKSSEYADGIYKYTVKAIKGSRTEFRDQIIQSIIPLDNKKLYLLPELQLRPVEILPFGKMMNSPKTEQNAFYFYSRFGNDGVRWVSYHFEKEADLTVPDPEMVGLMKQLFDGDIQK